MIFLMCLNILSFDHVRHLIFLILAFFLEPKLNMVLFFKIKISFVRHGRYIFYSNDAYVVVTHKNGVLFFSFGHGFFIVGA